MSEEDPKFSNSHLEKSLGNLLKESDTSKTKDKIIIDLNPNEGRWEYLYKLNKLKQIKQILKLYTVPLSCSGNLRKKETVLFLCSVDNFSHEQYDL